MMRHHIVTIMLTFIALPYFVMGQDAKEIVKKANDKSMGKSANATMEMQIIRPKTQRSLTMKTWSLGTSYYMVLITAPSREKGQVFMKRKTEMWNWLPSISRMIKIPSSMMSQSWMGSDFTNDDLVKMNSIVNDYTHKLLGEEEISGFPCYKIEMIPHEQAAVVWGKVILWVSKDEYLQLKAEYFDEDMQLVNTMVDSDVKELGGRLLPARMEMIPNNKKGNKTVMVLKEQAFNIDIEESFFSQQMMRRIK